MENGEAKPQAPAWTKRLGWGVTVTFLVLWSFVLGILVGQGSILAPKHLKAVQEFMGLAPEPEADEPVVVDTEDPTKMSFYKGTKGAAPPQLPPAVKPVQPKAKPQEDKKGWSVQIASFRERQIALDMVQQLKKDNLPAYLVRAQIKDVGLRYRVRVGPYENRPKADRMVSVIKSQYQRNGLVLEEK